MFWYLLNILITILVWLAPATVHNIYDTEAEADALERRKKRTCVIATLNWILLSGLRGLSVGADTLSYKINRFDRTMTRSWTEVLSDFYLKYRFNTSVKDPGYTLLEKTFHLFSHNYQIFLIFIAVFFFISLGVLIYKYSSNPCVSYIVFDCLFYSFFAVTGHRQTIATALVVFLGIYLIRDRKLLLFIIVCLLASTIHSSALCFIPFYWISKIKINKISLTFYWTAVVLSFVFRYRFLAILQGIIGYERYQDFEGAGAGAFLILLILMAMFVTVFYRMVIDADNPFMQFSANALMTACIFSSLLLINQSCMRVVQYFSLFIIFVLPECRYVFKEGKSRSVFLIICCCAMITLMVRNNPQYVFFWQEV